jgi:hypothetical protein
MSDYVVCNVSKFTWSMLVHGDFSSHHQGLPNDSKGYRVSGAIYMKRR